MHKKIKLIEVLTKEERTAKEAAIISSRCLVAKSEDEIQRGKAKEAGDYLLGPILGSSPVKSMVQCLGRKKGTDEFYTLKILTIKDNEEETQDDRQGKMLLHTEHSLLLFLDGYPGIMKQHGLFQDYAYDVESKQDDRVSVSSKKLVRRICLVLDCVYAHDYDPYSANYINLQHYVISKRKLTELDAFTIFFNIVSVIDRLHELNVIHRDIKLANLVLNQRSRQITLINFCLGQHLVSENDRLQDQRGSPAYISPEVLIGKPYLGKPSDMWALGVLLFTMLFGQFPFYHKFHQELFKMIKTASYTFPSDSGVKKDTLDIIRGLLLLDPGKRLTAQQVLTKLTGIITSRLALDSFPAYDSQIVPDVDDTGFTSDNSHKLKLKANDNDVIDTNDLDYFIHRIPFESQDKKVPGYSAAKSIPCSLASSEKSRSNKSVSIIEGDIRNFTQVDLYLHRNLFPHYSGPELMRWQSKERFSQSNSHVNHPGRSTVRVSASSSSVPTMDIPPMNGSHNMYDFPPARRWALAFLQQLNNYPDNKPPTVPQIDCSSDGAVPSTSRLMDPIEDHPLSSGSGASNSQGSLTSSFGTQNDGSKQRVPKKRAKLGKLLEKSPMFLRVPSDPSLQQNQIQIPSVSGSNHSRSNDLVSNAQEIGLINDHDNRLSDNAVISHSSSNDETNSSDGSNAES